MDTPSGTSLDELLDQLDHELKDREERERKSSGSDVYLNVYDMVNGVYVYVRVRTCTCDHYPWCDARIAYRCRYSKNRAVVIL